MLLAFDTATPLVSVALLRTGDHAPEVVAVATSDRAMKHGEQLAPLIEQVLASAGASRHDLTEIGVGVGPGPFTGLRVGLVTARTLGHVLSIPVHGLCSLDAIAAEVVAAGAPLRGFVVATDARRKEVYVASYAASGGRLEGPAVQRPEDVATELPTAGEGPVLYPESFPNAIGPTRPDAGWLGRALVTKTAERLDPEPLYLRRPDAALPPPRKPALTVGPQRVRQRS